MQLHDSDNIEKPTRKRKRVPCEGGDIFDQIPKPKGLYIVRKFGADRKNEFVSYHSSCGLLLIMCEKLIMGRDY